MSDRQKLREREQRLAVTLFAALTMWPRPCGCRSCRPHFHRVAQELIPDIQVNEVETALMLAGTYSDEDAATVVARADEVMAERQNSGR